MLSRDIKRNKQQMIWICLLHDVRAVRDMFWLIEPNFKDAAANLPSQPLGILAYVTVPVAMLACWVAYYMTQLMERPLVVVNDPHLEEMLEPEHAH